MSGLRRAAGGLNLKNRRRSPEVEVRNRRSVGPPIGAQGSLVLILPAEADYLCDRCTRVARILLASVHYFESLARAYTLQGSALPMFRITNGFRKSLSETHINAVAPVDRHIGNSVVPQFGGALTGSSWLYGPLLCVSF
jgi:hypothetical protein